MAFYGKLFVVEKEENFEDLVKAVGLSEERAQKFLEHKPTQKIENNGDGYTFYITSSLGEKVFKFKSGVEFADTLRDMNVKITMTVDGNKLTQVVKFENGAILTVKKEYADNSFTEEISHSKWNGVARRIYKAQ